jgi:ribosomal protein S18 acetylase RimI-like enzyme
MSAGGPAAAPAIAPAGAADLAALADLMGASPLLRRYQTTRARAREALERAHRAGDLLLVGRPPGEPPLGLAWVIGSRILTGAAYLRLLLVAEGHQGSGLGARLLAAAEAGARASANHLVLLVTTDNQGARRFYERHGYRHVGDLPGFALPGLDEALYHKALRGPGGRLPV